MRSLFGVFLALLTLPFEALLADNNERAMVEKHLADIYFADVHDRVSERFEGSGLLASEIDEAVSKIIDGYARCVIAAITEDDHPVSRKFYEVIREGKTSGELNKALSEFDEFEMNDWRQRTSPYINACAMTVDQEAGVP